MSGSNATSSLCRIGFASTLLALPACGGTNATPEPGGSGGAGASTSSVVSSNTSTGVGSASASSSGSGSSGGSSSGGSSSGGSSSGGSSSGGAGGSVGHKAPQKGLIDMGVTGLAAGITPSSNPSEIAPYAGSITGIVVNAAWADLQPTGPTPLVSGDTLDQQIQAVRDYNQNHPPISVKIRVQGSFKAPMWAMQLDGGPIMITADPSEKDARGGPIGLYWKSDYINYWRQLQKALADKYDGDPIVSEVAVTSCSFQTDEPFVVPANSYLAPLQAAGYGDMEEQACLSGALDDYAPYWKKTWIDFTFNSYHLIGGTQDPGFLDSVMQSCTTANNCILANHALADDTPTGHGGPDVYSEFLAQSSVSTVNLQTFAPDPGSGDAGVDGWCQLIPIAETYHAASIELWPQTSYGGFTTLSPAQVANLATAFSSGTTPDPSQCP